MPVFPAVDKLSAALQMLESRVALLEQPPAPAAGPGAQVGPLTPEGEQLVRVCSSKRCGFFHQAKQAENADEDDLDLFGSEEEEDEEAARIKQERLDAYAAKKSKKAALIAKSSILLDVKPVGSSRSASLLASAEGRILQVLALFFFYF